MRTPSIGLQAAEAFKTTASPAAIGQDGSAKGGGAPDFVSMIRAVQTGAEAVTSDGLKGKAGLDLHGGKAIAAPEAGQAGNAALLLHHARAAVRAEIPDAGNPEAQKTAKSDLPGAKVFAVSAGREIKPEARPIAIDGDGAIAPATAFTDISAVGQMRGAPIEERPPRGGRVETLILGDAATDPAVATRSGDEHPLPVKPDAPSMETSVPKADRLVGLASDSGVPAPADVRNIRDEMVRVPANMSETAPSPAVSKTEPVPPPAGMAVTAARIAEPQERPLTTPSRTAVIAEPQMRHAQEPPSMTKSANSAPPLRAVDLSSSFSNAALSQGQGLPAAPSGPTQAAAPAGAIPGNATPGVMSEQLYRMQPVPPVGQKPASAPAAERSAGDRMVAELGADPVRQPRSAVGLQTADAVERPAPKLNAGSIAPEQTLSPVNDRPAPVQQAAPWSALQAVTGDSSLSTNMRSLVTAIEHNSGWTKFLSDPVARLSQRQGPGGVNVDVLKIDLHPAKLGRMEASLRVQGDVMTVTISVASREAAASIGSDVAAIQSGLRAAGFSVDSVIVETQAQSEGRPGQEALRQDASAGGSARQGSERGNTRSAQGPDIPAFDSENSGAEAAVSSGGYVI